MAYNVLSGTASTVFMEDIFHSVLNVVSCCCCQLIHVFRAAVVIVALSTLLSQLSLQSNTSKLSDDISCLLAGLVPDSSSNSTTLHSTAAELLSSM